MQYNCRSAGYIWYAILLLGLIFIIAGGTEKPEQSRVNPNQQTVMSNYYVQLSESELQQIEGGSILGGLAIGLLITAFAQIVGDWDNFKNGLAGRPEEK
jgi:bacteriocin-like protein